ncbi:translation initiation factor 2A [Paragonimus westermani]|uniref:Translation initiation factor 2A n=1 Tax=Paragonimus westermani TaxID=34504 RepID=A0A5J4NCF7_9TREM|nr:translation initiation factor 2A [Paragonimus westermani]
MSVWDFDRCERLSCFKTTDITSLAWLNDGEHLLMATTTPRLRVNNGFGVWHYSGQQIFFKRVDPRAVPRPATLDLPAATEHELYQIHVLPVTELPPAPVPRKFEPSADSTANPTKKYVPPALRNRSDVAKQSISASFPSENIAPGRYQPPSTKVDLPVGLDPSYLVSQKSKKRKSKSNSQNQASVTSTSSLPISAQPNRHAPGDSLAEKNKKIRVLKKASFCHFSNLDAR